MAVTSTTATYAIREDIPAHVPPTIVYDYDAFSAGPPGSDIFEELFQLKYRAPPIFWTPYKRRPLDVTDTALAEQVLSDNVHFSSQVLLLPREAIRRRAAALRRSTSIRRSMGSIGGYADGAGRKFVVDALPGIRAFAVELIEGLKPKGRCRFHCRVRL